MLPPFSQAIELDPGGGGGTSNYQYVDVTITFKYVENFIDTDSTSAGDFRLKIWYDGTSYTTGVSSNGYEDHDPPAVQSLKNQIWGGWWIKTFNDILISSGDVNFQLWIQDKDGT